MRKGCALTIVLLVGILVAMFIFCPSEAQHKAVISKEFGAAINERFGITKNDNSIMSSVFSIIGQTTVGIGSDFSVNQMVKVDNYYLFSIGRINIAGKEHIVSIGILNHVFAPDKDDIIMVMKEYGI